MKKARSPFVPLVVALTVLVTAGCPARRAQFEPAERATARAPEGYTAAHYVLETPERRLGEVKVWSRGTFRANINGTRRTVLHVGFSVENHSDSSLHLLVDQLRLDSATINECVLRDHPPVSVRGEPDIAAGRVGDVEVYFAMPRGVSPRDVNAFRLHWRVENAAFTYTQHTPFLEAPEIYRTAWGPGFFYSPFYDPFFYDPFFYPYRFTVFPRPFVHRHVIRTPRRR